MKRKKVCKELATEKLCYSENKDTYRRKVDEVLRGTRLGIGNESRVSYLLEVLKKSLMHYSPLSPLPCLHAYTKLIPNS